MPNSRWYQDGLRFGCTQCGNCCRNHGDYAYVYLAEGDIVAIAAFLRIARADFLARYCKEDGGWVTLRTDAPACTFLQADNRCAIYEVRPKQCATWPFWTENLERTAWEGAVKACCPGIGQGELHDVDEIERCARETDEGFEE